MKTTLDNLEQRLKQMDGALRLRWAEPGDPWSPGPSAEERPSDVLRLRRGETQGGRFLDSLRPSTPR
jgi:hypothetical protein